MFDAHIVSMMIGDAFFSLQVFLEIEHANEYRHEQEETQGGSYVVHSRPLYTGGWSLR